MAKEKKERVDKTKNKIKVIKELLRDPLQTDREIAKNANIGLGTTQDNLQVLCSKCNCSKSNLYNYDHNE